MSANEDITRHRAAVVSAALAILVLIVGGCLLWAHSYGTASTDDAQIDGHVHPINARIGGTVVWVNSNIDDTKFVEAGTVLARLDTNDYRPAVDRLTGDVESEQAQLQSAQLAVPITSANTSSRLGSAHAAVAESEAELASAKAGEAAAQAQISQAQASFHRAEGDRARYEQLMNSHEISRSEYDARMTEANVASAQLAAAQANLQAAQQRIQAALQHVTERQQDVMAASVAPQLVATAQSSVQRVSGELKKSEASLHDAQLNLSYTEIVAPVSGIVGRRSLEVGQRIAPGQLILNIVPTNDLWVTANFKETQLGRIRPGDTAKIYVDSYGIELHGSVESIGGATGSKYALIAPDNATGNYVKVVQRIPVRLHIASAQASDRPLLPGMSVEVRIKR
jgi:membrane fusion protein (multidrug efflux system)